MESNNLNTALSRIGFRISSNDLQVKPKSYIDIEETIIKALYEARNDGRLLSLIFSWQQFNGEYLITEKFFKVRDRYESYIDKEALVPMAFIRKVNEGGYKINQNYVYNHYKKQVISEGKAFDVPKDINDIQDMLSAFYYARCIDFSNAKAGNIYTVNSFVDEEVFPLKIKYIGKETISTSLGKFKCIKFRPVIQKGRIFKDEEDLNVWISDDANRIPIRAQANILVGSVKMDLMDYKGLANPIAKIE